MTEPKITELLVAARGGVDGAMDALFPHVYDHLRKIAHARLLNVRSGNTLDTTALVHEAYVRLIDPNAVQWNDRAHFFAVASKAMRFILVDYAREKNAQKRGRGDAAVPLDEIQIAAESDVEARATELLTLDRALEVLRTQSERLADLVEFKFFGGLTYEEIAEVTGRSVPTIKRDWRRARTWLYESMQEP